jgi:hypothetical protein
VNSVSKKFGSSMWTSFGLILTMGPWIRSQYYFLRELVQLQVKKIQWYESNVTYRTRRGAP